MEPDRTEQIDLTAVYNALTSKPVFRSKKTQKLFDQFTTLMAQKSSFAHKVHKSFNSLANMPQDLSA